MNDRKKMLFAFIVKTFLVAAACNAVIALTVVHYDTENSFSDLPGNFLFIAAVSLACFFPVCLLIFLVSWFAGKTHPETLFWINMAIALVATTLLFTEAKQFFLEYGEWTNVFTVIGIFSILVSITSQYQLFIGDKDDDDAIKQEPLKRHKAFDPNEGLG